MSLEDKIAHLVSGRNRRKKFDYFMDFLVPDESTKILDVGPAEEEYSKTDNLIEKIYPYPENLSALGIDKFNEFCKRYPKVKVFNYDGKRFPFGDDSFDICWSNAVIEHVGDYDRQVLFLEEIRRVAKRAFITTPNRYFPIEVHTRIPLLHFFPKRIFDRFLRLVGKEWAAGGYMFVRSYSEIRNLLKDSGNKNYFIKRNRFLFFTLDFIIVLDNGENGAAMQSLKDSEMNQTNSHVL
jgi:SAM-dependent methyltransferase